MKQNLRLLGKFNLYNLLGAIGAVKCLGMKDEEIIGKNQKHSRSSRKI